MTMSSVDLLANLMSEWVFLFLILEGSIINWRLHKRQRQVRRSLTNYFSVSATESEAAATWQTADGIFEATKDPTAASWQIINLVSHWQLNVNLGTKIDSPAVLDPSFVAGCSSGIGDCGLRWRFDAVDHSWSHGGMFFCWWTKNQSRWTNNQHPSNQGPQKVSSRHFCDTT
jgi:hypothetical protein